MNDRVLGDIATALLFENERVRVWEMLQIAGDKMAAKMEEDSGGPWGHLGYIEGDVAPGNVLYAERGGVERAVNVGQEPFFEIVVELKG